MSGSGPLDVLVVGWYPAPDDPIAGRFVADQAAALLATGRVRPWIASFEPFTLHGDRSLREAAVAAWLPAVTSAVREGRAFAPRGATGPDGVPTLRLGVPAGGTSDAARTHQAVHRGAVLGAALDGAGPGRWPLLHAHVGYPEGAGVAAAARRAGLPFVLTEHATYLDRLFADREIRAAYHDGARAAARIVAVSAVLANRIATEFPDLADRLVVIPNTVDVASFRAAGPAERDPDELLWVGYRREVKGTAVLLEAFRLVREARPATRLRLVGRSTTDEEEAGWHRLAAQLGVADAVAFDPPADRAGVAAAMARAAVFVHPSRIETMGVVAVEALASGLPVVAVDSGGVTEVLGPDPGAVGALVPEQSAERLATALLATLERRAAFDPTRLRGHVEDRYGAPGVANRLADLYDDVLAEAGRPSSMLRGARGLASAARGAARATQSAAPARSPESVAPPAGIEAVLVGFERHVLERTLVTFPAAAFMIVPIATVGGPIAGHTPVLEAAASERDLAAVLAMRGRARGNGPLGLALAPARWLVRGIRRRQLLGRVLPRLTVAVGAAVDAAAPGGIASGGPVTIVPIGGLDVLAAGPVVAARRAVLAPGGPRWLADRTAG